MMFAMLFFPMALERFGLPAALLLTNFCILYIRGVYFIRAVIFTKICLDSCLR